MSSERRASIWAVIIVVVVGIGGGFFVAQRLLAPSDGASQDINSDAPWYIDQITASLDPGSPLKAGDMITAINGRSLLSWQEAAANPFASHPQWHDGQQVIYTVEHDGQQQDITVTLRPFPVGAFLAQTAWYFLAVALAEVIAIYVFARRFEDGAARLVFLAFSLTMIYQMCCTLSLGTYDFVGGTNLLLSVLWAAAAFPFSYALFAHFALTFPRPLPLIQRHRSLLWLLYLAPGISIIAVCSILISLVSKLPVDLISSLYNVLDNANLIACLGSIVVMSVGALISYVVNSDTVARQQWRLVIVPVALTRVVSFAQPWLSPLLSGLGIITTNPHLGNGGHDGILPFLSLMIPLGMAVAILRYHLWDLDLIINRSLIYGVLSLILFMIYSLIILALGVILASFTTNARALIATGIVAILFQPLRTFVQHQINRLFYGLRDEPYQALAQMGQRLAATSVPEAILPVITETVGQVLKVPYVAIALERDGKPMLDVAYGTATKQLLRLPLTYQQTRVGELLLASRTPDETFGPSDERLLADLAHQIGIAVHALQLAHDLQKSRERLVLAREEERRRLRRDLHDGLGPTLAALALRAGAVGELIPGQPEQAINLAETLSVDIRSTVGEIRRLVHALRPPTLDELGLLAALNECVAHYQDVATTPRVILTVPQSLPALPAAVEVVALRVTQEALTNVVRHAQAQTCRITMTTDATALTITVCDDGIGIAPEHRQGIGLQSMRERAEEVGGSCLVVGNPGNGTKVFLTLPLSQEEK